MTVKAAASITHPHDVEVAITITMTAGEWKRLISTIPSEYPGWPVCEAIQKALDAFSRTHYSLVEYERP